MKTNLIISLLLTFVCTAAHSRPFVSPYAPLKEGRGDVIGNGGNPSAPEFNEMAYELLEALQGTEEIEPIAVPVNLLAVRQLIGRGLLARFPNPYTPANALQTNFLPTIKYDAFEPFSQSQE